MVIFKMRSIFTKKMHTFPGEFKNVYLLGKKHGYSYNFATKMLISQNKILFHIVKLEVCMKKNPKFTGDLKLVSFSACSRFARL